ncbi:MAG: hypothetical protein NTY53_00875, partial [Kiritimatiellaeota bacterium]|nr:hypothetical protein [Kiritimatiellota bacterium]
MKILRPVMLGLRAGGALVVGLWLGRLPPSMQHGTPPPRLEKRVITRSFHPAAPMTAAVTTRSEEPPTAPGMSAEERQLLKLQRKLDKPGAKPNEALLKFGSSEALRAFLARAQKAGVKVLGQLGNLNALRVGYEQLGQLSTALGSEAEASEITMDPNFIAQIPDILQKEDRPAGSGA